MLLIPPMKFVINTLRLRQNGRHFTDDIFKCIFLNENIWISINISLNSVPNGQISNVPALVQIMAWHQPGDKPLTEPVMVILWCICASLGLNELIHCGLVTPNGVTDLGQHWLRYWFVVWWHKPITEPMFIKDSFESNFTGNAQVIYH